MAKSCQNPQWVTQKYQLYHRKAGHNRGITPALPWESFPALEATGRKKILHRVIHSSSGFLNLLKKCISDSRRYGVSQTCWFHQKHQFWLQQENTSSEMKMKGKKIVKFSFSSFLVVCFMMHRLLWSFTKNLHFIHKAFRHGWKYYGNCFPLPLSFIFYKEVLTMTLAFERQFFLLKA